MFEDYLKISIIIPSYNEEDNIERCIKSLNKVDYPNKKKEIILVDNGSTDTTVVIASHLGAKVVVRENVTVGELRNIGVRESTGDIFAFLDADCSVNLNWLFEALATFSNEEIGVTGSCVLPPSSGNCIEQAWGRYLIGKNSSGEVAYINSGNCFIKKEAFLKVKGFSKTLESSEDTDICNRIKKAGYIIYYNNKIKAVHWGYPKNIFNFMRREIWHGLGATEKNIGNFLKSKPLCLAIYNIFVLSFFLFFIKEFDILKLVLVVWILPYLLIALKSCFNRKKIFNFPVLFILFITYGVSRSISLLLFCFNHVVDRVHSIINNK